MILTHKEYKYWWFVGNAEEGNTGEIPYILT